MTCPERRRKSVRRRRRRRGPGSPSASSKSTHGTRGPARAPGARTTVSGSSTCMSDRPGVDEVETDGAESHGHEVALDHRDVGPRRQLPSRACRGRWRSPSHGHPPRRTTTGPTDPAPAPSSAQRQPGATPRRPNCLMVEASCSDWRVPSRAASSGAALRRGYRLGRRGQCSRAADRPVSRIRSGCTRAACAARGGRSRTAPSPTASA